MNLVKFVVHSDLVKMKLLPPNSGKRHKVVFVQSTLFIIFSTFFRAR